MRDQQKTKSDLMAELAELRQEVDRLQTRLAMIETEDPATGLPASLEEPHLQAALENIGLIVVTLNIEGQIIFCNDFLLDLTGWSRPEVMGQDWFQTLLPPNIRATVRTVFLDTVRTGQFPVQYQNEIITRQGEHRLINWYNTVYRDVRGQVVKIISLGEDVTDRIKTEEALRQSEQRYKQLYQMFRLMADNVPDLIWAKDMEKRFIFTNKAICEKLLNALDTEEPIGKTDMFFAQRERNSHPENPDWHTFGEICADSDSIVIESKQPQRFDEFGNVQGKFLFLDVHKAPFWDENGEMIGTVGSGRDVTREKEIERALATERTLLRTVIDNLPIHIYAKDKQSRFLLSNISHARHVGHKSSEELLGKTDFDLYPPALAQKFQADDRHVIATGQTVSNREEESINTDGDRLFFSVIKVPLHDSDGNIIGLVGTGRDITELKQTEEALRLYTQRLQTLHEIDQAVLAARSPQAIAGEALSRLRQIVPCQRTSVVEYLDERRKYIILAVDTTGETSLTAGKIFDSNPATISDLQQGAVIRVKNIADCSPLTPVQQTLLAEGIKSFVVIPLLVQDKLIGALHLSADTINAFSKDQIEIAGEVAASLAIAIVQANLYAQTRQDAETKETLLREVNHRVHNNLSTIISLLNMEQERAMVDSPEAFKTRISELINRVRGLATVHRLLSDTMWAPLLLQELAEKIIKLGIDILSPRKYIATVVSPSSVRISAQFSNTLALILNELVTNSVKHAWPNREHGQITMTISQNNTHIALQYRDDGQGYSDQMLQEHRYNLGLRLVKSLVSHGLQGKLTLFNDNGAGALIQFSLKEEQP